MNDEKDEKDEASKRTPGEGPSEDERLATYRQQFIDWDDATLESRERAMRDRDYYDGVQWTADQVEIFEKRNQPVITFNRIAGKVNYICGTEIDQRVDPRAYPRSPMHEEDADAVTDILRYIADQDNFDDKRSDVIRSVAIEGYGAVDLDVEENPEAPVPYDIHARLIEADEFYWDPHSRRPDFSDAAYKGVVKWVDMSEAKALWDDRIAQLELSRTHETGSGVTTTDRPRFWIKEEDRIQVFWHYYLDDYEGERVWWKCVWVAGGFLVDPMPIKWRTDKGKPWCPLIAISAYVRAGNSDDNERYGFVRQFLGAQDEINYRRSKAVHLMHTTRVIYEAGAIESPDEFQAELARPDGAAEVAPGRLSDKSVEVLQNHDLVAAQVSMLQEAKNEIDQMGPHALQQPAQQGEISGRLFIAAQEAASKELKPFFDNVRRWTLAVYRAYWWLARTYFTEECWIRVRDKADAQSYKFVALNKETTKLEQIQAYMERGQTLDQAMSDVFGAIGPRLLEVVTQMAQVEVQQQMAQQQQAMQMQAQQMQMMAMQAQQMGQPPPQMPQPQAPQPPDEKQMQGLVLKHLQMHIPEATKPYTERDVPALDCDIVLETSPNSALLEHEQYVEFVGLIGKGILQPTPKVVELVIKASAFHNKRELLAALTETPDPEQVKMQQQTQQLQLAQLQALVAKLNAEAGKIGAQAGLAQGQTQVQPSVVQLNQAKAALAGAQAQAVPVETQTTVQKAQAEVQNTQAQTLKTAHEAGQASVPRTGEGNEA